jgi:hypothetical protein
MSYRTSFCDLLPATSSSLIFFSLALTCWKLARATEGPLYEAPVIGEPYIECESPVRKRNHILAFARKLLRHTQLASKARSFSVSISKGGPEVVVEPETKCPAVSVLREIRRHSLGKSHWELEIPAGSWQLRGVDRSCTGNCVRVTVVNHRNTQRLWFQKRRRNIIWFATWCIIASVDTMTNFWKSFLLTLRRLLTQQFFYHPTSLLSRDLDNRFTYPNLQPRFGEATLWLNNQYYNDNYDSEERRRNYSFS